MKYMNDQDITRKSRGIAQANTLRKSDRGEDVEEHNGMNSLERKNTLFCGRYSR